MIDLEELRLAIRKMTRKQALYRVLKEELTARDHWKDLARGKADIRHIRVQQRRQNAPDDY